MELADKPIITVEILSNKLGDKLTVQDNGGGITEESMDNIFTPFYTTKKEGSGIGLSLSRQIMKLHRGNISVRSVEGQGTVFQLQF